MKLNRNRYVKFGIIALAITSMTYSACNKKILDETPPNFFSQKLTDLTAFNAASIGLYIAARDEQFRVGNQEAHIMWSGTDLMTKGEEGINRDINIELTPTGGSSGHYWEWGFTRIIPRANLILTSLTETGSVLPEVDRNRLEGEARFFRAYAYFYMVNLFGAVPIVDKYVTEPRTDFVRDPKQKVLEFMREDLKIAVANLPAKSGSVQKGRITKAAADHLLALVYIQLEDWDNAITSASRVINGTHGTYALMQERFGSKQGGPGAGKDVFWDLFRAGNVNSDANTETIWALQFEPNTTVGGVGQNGQGMNLHRGGGVRWIGATTPDNKPGMSTRKDPNSPANSPEGTIDTLLRGVAWMRPTNYWTTNIWGGFKDPSPTPAYNDIRNSNANIRRNWIWNRRFYNETNATEPNPYYGQVFNTESAKTNRFLDTVLHVFPISTKIEEVGSGNTVLPNNFNSGTHQDWYKMRLAETFLIRAEAYLGKGQKQLAADDINQVRRRARARQITQNEVTIDFILDERARELIWEEPRRITLARVGKLYERVQLYNATFRPRFAQGNSATTRVSIPVGASVQPYHDLFPIPQTVINANTGAPFPQNPGYPK
jgi:hypothetical protein